MGCGTGCFILEPLNGVFLLCKLFVFNGLCCFWFDGVFLGVWSVFGRLMVVFVVPCGTFLKYAQVLRKSDIEK